MNLHELAPVMGSTHVNKRKGRGTGTGNGKTAGRGHKGQKARSGAPRPGFEGGQLPLYRKLPKRGFHNKFATEYATVNVGALNAKFADGATVDLDALMAAKIVRDPKDGLKVLGGGELTKKLTVKAASFSASAKEKIEAAGGKAEEP